jgi:hypothetical protein
MRLWARRRCGLGDSGIDLVPDGLFGVVAEDGIQERYDAADIEVVGIDC